eukprot:5301630-Prymnesium_polylepis.1
MSMLVWDTFQAVLLPCHPQAAAAMAAQREAGAEAGGARSFEMLHYNGLSSAGEGWMAGRAGRAGRA